MQKVPNGTELSSREVAKIDCTSIKNVQLERKIAQAAFFISRMQVLITLIAIINISNLDR